MKMAEITVENKICKNCGADVRPNTQFCYNCGRAVSPETHLSENGNSYVTVKEKLLEEEKRQALEENPLPKPEKLKSAASLKKANKSVEKKRVEVVWEETEGASNLWFIVVAIVLTVFAIGILIAMLQLR